MTVHPLLDDGYWWACDHPERRSDTNTMFYRRCYACCVAALAALRNGHYHGARKYSRANQPTDESMSHAEAIEFYEHEVGL